MEHSDLCGASHVASCHRNRFGQVVGALPAEHGRNVYALRASGDDEPDALAAILAPVPHEERMRAVLGIATTINLDVRGIVGELTLIIVA